MINNILFAFLGLFLGIIFGFLFKNKNNSEFFILLNDFKKSLDEFKTKHEIDAKQINNAILETSKLTKILTTNQNLKGQYGENCLENIIKTCYPTQNIDYIKQYSTKNENNEEIRPDYIIKLPNNKSIIIDCKLNLEKYIEYKEATEQSLISSKKTEFIKDLNNTINNLYNKKYTTAIDIEQPDFMLMYIPLEPILTLIYTDKDFISIIKNASQKNIIIVGNSSVITTLKLVDNLWAQNTQQNNIENIISLAENIYNYIAIHSKNLYEVKKTIELAHNNFIKEYEKITSDNLLFKNTQQLVDCGIKTVSKKSGKKWDEIKIHEDFLK